VLDLALLLLFRVRCHVFFDDMHRAIRASASIVVECKNVIAIR
jgi:hypothetical protein